MPVRKTLYILRHAKAEAGSASQEDFDRGLNDQGVAACTVIGKYLADQAIKPELVLCSTAKRTRDTWELIKPASKIKAPEEFIDRLYLASANEIAGQVARVPETFQRVMVISHNPGLHQLCIALAKHGDSALLDTLHLKFPTCAFAAIDLGEIAWRDIALADGMLKAFVTPRLLKN